MTGHIISHFRILEKLGAGGMGEVYLAEDTNLDRKVALKFLPPHLSGDEEANQRFVQEAKAASALNHPNVCTIHEIGHTDDGQTFIAMAFYEGATLKQKLASGALPIEEAADIARQVAEGLAAAHEQGIIHRDIKPANIFITKRGRAVILDFGLAKLTGSLDLTKPGSTLGTAYYMSPEQIRGEEVDHRTDIWSLGVVLYELLAGQLPYKGDYESAVIYSILNEEAASPSSLRSDVSLEMEVTISRALMKDRDSRYSSIRELLAELEKHCQTSVGPNKSPSSRKALLQAIRKPVIALPATLVLLALIVSLFVFDRRARIAWAKEVAIPQVKELVEIAESERTGYFAAFDLALDVERYIPDDSTLQELLSRISIKTSIKTKPSAASIYVKEYNAFDSDWEFLGTTPIDSIRLARGYYRWKIEESGYETSYRAMRIGRSTGLIEFELYEEGTVPPGMIRVKGVESELGLFPDFFYDKYEVTNREFKTFIEDGGYLNREYWKYPFEEHGRTLEWDEAISRFIDETGRPGPATWLAGDYPEGQDDHPVTGVSWYEAAAYAAFRKKVLPTVYHWSIANAAVPSMTVGQVWPVIPLFIIAPQSNFGAEGPTPVGSHPGIGLHGAYDIAGNVREWCHNENQRGRSMLGGAWNDPPYMSFRITQASPFDRSPQNGFRCAQYINADSIPDLALQPYNYSRENDDYRYVDPVPDEIFEVYKEAFSYDKEPLNGEIESRDATPNDWVKEEVSFDAAYNDERVFAHLYLPKNTPEPYQTIIFFPPSTGLKSSQNLAGYFDFYLKSGRAVLFPVYKNTFERGGSEEEFWDLFLHVSTRRYFDALTKIVLDFRRSVDYLETREDIDIEKIAYYSFSWGGELVSIIAAVEERLKLNILNSGGMRGFDAGGRIYPMADPINYVTRVRVPTLMLNGEYDMIYQYDKVVEPMYDLLGTPDKDKQLLTYPTDHFVPWNELVRESLNWLDRYFGPVR